MKKFIQIVSFAFLMMLSSCNDKNELQNDEELIVKEPTFDRSKFIAQSKEKSASDYQFGPRSDNKPIGRTRESLRKLISKEESFDYADTSEINLDNFKMSINIENMDIRTFGEMVSRVTGVNILVSDEVKGNVTAKLHDVYWTSMLDSVLKTKQLEKYVDSKSNIIRIHDQNTVVQLEDFDRKRKENVQRALLLKKASQPLYTEIFKLFYTKPESIKQTIEDVLVSKTAQQGSDSARNINPEITIDKRRNMLIVKARKEDIEVISKLIGELDTRTEQVFIEAFIVEVTDGFEKAFGSKIGMLSGNDFIGGSDKNFIGTIGGVAGSTGSVALGNSASSLSDLAANGATGGIGFVGGIGAADQLKIELTALEKQGLTKVISNPKIFTLDNQEAIIFQGDEVPYETFSQQEGQKIEFKEAGLRLAVTPTIIGDGNLMLNLAVNKDTVDLSKDKNPPITKSEIKSNLVTKDGEIVVMGGIYTESKAKSLDRVPGLGSVPGVGRLFRRDRRDDDRKELIIFIAPKIL